MSQTKVKSGLLNFPDQTDFVKLPSGTTAQRPSSPEKGYSRYNTTDNKLEYWNGTIWQQLPGVVPPTIESVSYPGDDLAADPAGGQTITLTGTNFLVGASVEIDGTTASVVTVVSKTEITFTSPAKAAGDYDILLTNGDNTTATFVDGMTYNGLPSWTTPAGNLGTFAAGSTIPTITLIATEPDSGVVSYSVTTGALPTGLTLTGADIDGTVPSPAGQTTYNFSVTASDDENQESTERAFNIVVYLQVTNTVDEVDPFGDSSGLALYKFDGDATDESGNYDGNFVGASYTAGIFGQAGVFNADNKYMDSLSPIGISASNANDDVTVSTWIKFNSVITTGATALFGLPGTGTGAFHIYLYGHSDGLAISFERSFDNKAHYADGYNTLMKYPFISGVWYNLITTYEGSTKIAKAYVNGSKVPNTLTLIQRNTNANTSQTIRMGVDRNTLSINSLIDQTRIFNKLLTPLEIESLYRERTVVCGGQADTLDILGDNSCIATYQLDGNANDLSGNYSGTPTNVSYGVGEFDLAGVFNGSSSRITTAASQLPIPASGTFTVSFWAKVDSSLTQYNTCMMSFGDFWLKSEYVTGRFGLGDPNTGYETTSSMGYGWNHCVLTVDASNNINLYLNGANEFTGNKSISRTNGGNFAIGVARLSSPVYYFNGQLDQVRIFNKALSAGEVTTLYNETACDPIPVSYSNDSVYFNGTSQELRRTPSAASNQKTFTISYWFRNENNPPSQYGGVVAQGNDGNNFDSFLISTDGVGFWWSYRLSGGTQANLQPDYKYLNADWHHVVIAVDTTQSTSYNRVKYYLDGNLIANYGTEIYYSQNFNTFINSTSDITIGGFPGGDNLFSNVHIANFHLIDGQQLTASDFGEYDAPIWSPKEYSGSYGTNGFLLNFSDPNNLGLDSSGNGNNFSEINMDSSNHNNNFYI